jgi:hypothetical protein
MPFAPLFLDVATLVGLRFRLSWLGLSNFVLRISA